MGVACNTMSIYLPYIVKNHGFTGAQSSAIATVRNLSAFLTMPLVTGYYKKFSLRTGGALTFLSSAGAFLVFSRATTPLGFYVGSAFAGVGYSFGTMIAASLLAERWFAQRKGFAIGVAAAGSGVASFAFPPVISFLVENFSMSAAFLTEGAICVCSGVVYFLIARDDPAAMGLAPYGAGGSNAVTVKNHPDTDLPHGMFLVCCAAMVMLGGTSTAAPAHYAILSTSNGVEPATAAMAVSAAGLFLLVGKFVYGDVCDRLGGKRGSTIFMLILTAGCFICSTMHAGIIPLMFAGIICCGAGFAPVTVGVSIWAADFFTGKRFAASLKWFQTCSSLGGMICSVVPGILYDRLGNYNVSYVMFGIFVLVSMVIVRRSYAIMEKAAVGERV